MILATVVNFVSDKMSLQMSSFSENMITQMSAFSKNMSLNKI